METEYKYGVVFASILRSQQEKSTIKGNLWTLLCFSNLWVLLNKKFWIIKQLTYSSCSKWGND